ncbi:MAG TPA: hypothetical protein VI757_12250 [Bacteroidia bacterium]|nr:hypothetical protein [Bacteroidia bacterium]
MKRKFYLPPTDNGRLAWLQNFSSKIGTYAAALGITPLEVSAIAAFYLMLVYILGIIEQVRTFSQDLTKFKETLMVAPLGTPPGAVPSITLAAPPAAVDAGIFTIIAGFVKRIKGSVNYNVGIGEDLGIIGADIILDFGSMQPDLKITFDVLRPKIKYKKGGTDGLNIYVDRNDGQGIRFLKYVTKTTYIDTEELPAGVNSAVWAYIGIYVVNDTEVGIPSAAMSVTVSRMV